MHHPRARFTCWAFFVCLLTSSAVRLGATETAVPLTDYVRVSWTQSEGLAAAQIWALAQDVDGYLWLGTNSGLMRFDGVRFVNWNTLRRPRLANSSIKVLRVTRDGALWIGHGANGGIARYRQGEFTQYNSADGIHPTEITSIAEDTDGTIFAGQHVGLAAFHGGRWERLTGRGGIPDVRVHDLLAARDGSVWVATDKGVYHRPHSDAAFSIQTGAVAHALVQDDVGRVWAMGERLPLCELAPSLTCGRREFDESIDVRGTRLLRDGAGGFWYATSRGGIARFNPASPAPRVELLRGVGRLSSDSVQSLLADREGNLWVGTQRGLNRLSRPMVTAVPSDNDPTFSRNVRAAAITPDGSLWAGTAEGLYRLSHGRWRRLGPDAGLPSADITALHAGQGEFWVATQSGLARLRGDRFEAVAGVHLDATVRAMTSDSSGTLWLCDWQNELLQLDRYGVLHVVHDVVQPFSAYTDRSGRVWIGTLHGTLHLYEGTRPVREFSAKDGLTGGMVMSILEDQRGSIWLGSFGGLSRFDGDSFETVTEDTGLPGAIVQAIAEDEDGNLWLGMNTGIARVRGDPLDGLKPGRGKSPYTVYDEADGLRGTPVGIGQPLAARAMDGTLWFVTSGGLAALHPRQSDQYRLPAPVRIESLTVNHETVMPANGLRLPPGVANLQIDYTALSFVASNKIRFRYRLEGFDDDWINAGTRRQAFYTNLPPGPYRFRVAADNGAVASGEEALLAFSIQPMFYQTTLFRVSSALAVLLAIGAIWQLRVQQVRQSFALVLAERTRMAREVHDTLLQGLVGVAVQFGGLAADIESSPRTAKAGFDRLRKQVEINIREARQAILDLRSPMLETRDLATALREVATRLTAGKGPRFDLRVYGSAPGRARRVEEQLLRIGQEAVSNAVRHAAARHIGMELHYLGDGITLRVTDDGCGFDFSRPEEHIEEHWGLASMQERTEQIGGRLRVLSAEGRGTKIEATVPVTWGQ